MVALEFKEPGLGELRRMSVQPGLRRAGVATRLGQVRMHGGPDEGRLCFFFLSICVHRWGWLSHGGMGGWCMGAFLHAGCKAMLGHAETQIHLFKDFLAHQLKPTPLQVDSQVAGVDLHGPGWRTMHRPPSAQGLTFCHAWP